MRYSSRNFPPAVTQKSSMVSYDEEDEDSDIFGESDRDDDDDEDNTEVYLLGPFLNICPFGVEFRC